MKWSNLSRKLAHFPSHHLPNSYCYRRGSSHNIIQNGYCDFAFADHVPSSFPPIFTTVPFSSFLLCTVGMFQFQAQTISCILYYQFFQTASFFLLCYICFWNSVFSRKFWRLKLCFVLKSFILYLWKVEKLLENNFGNNHKD